MRVEEEQSGGSRSAVGQLPSLSHHQVLASSELKVPQGLNKSSKPWARAGSGPCGINELFFRGTGPLLAH